MLYSFDVFDTLIKRKTEKSEDIFKIMQTKLQDRKYELLISKYARNNFALLRKKAESLTRENYIYDSIEDITLEQIYSALYKTGHISKEAILVLMNLEVATECENVLPIWENINQVQELRKNGNRVVFISDMYLSEKNVSDIIKSAAPEIADVKLYVSSEYKKNKWNRSLYWLIKQMENVEFNDWVHVGDNLYSDVEMPCALGITAIPYNNVENTLFQNYLKETECDSVQLGKTIVISNYICQTEQVNKIEKIGVTTGANILYPYVEWILDDAVQRGITRLYFIARDGYILKAIADKIIQAQGLKINTEYIYGSRQAWRLASISLRNNDLKQFISWSHAFHIVTLQDLAETFKVTVNELMNYLPMGIDCNIKLEKYELYLLMDQLNRNVEFVRFLINQQKVNRELVLEYLRQNVDFNDENYAFVELAGSGYTQYCLSDILRDIKETSVKTYYYKMDRLNRWDNCEFFVFNPEARIENILIEMICRSVEGRTIGYTRLEEKVVPIFDSEEKELQNYEYKDYIKGILLYADYMCSMKESLLENAVEISGAYLLALIENPNCEEAVYFMNMPDNVTGRDRKPIAFAPELTNQQLKEIYYTRWCYDREKYYKGSCLELSLVRSGDDKKGLSQKYMVMAESLWQRQHQALRSWKDCFPVKLLGKRVALYAAGIWGKEFYNILTEQYHKEIIVWVDKNHEKCKQQGLPVEDVIKLKEIEFDSIIIAVKSQDIAEQIRQELLKLGIQDHKIWWLNVQDLWKYMTRRQPLRWI